MDKADWAILGKGKFILTAIIMVAVLALPSFIYTGSYIIADAPAPKEGVELPPNPDETLSEGLLFIVLDGGVRDLMLDKDLMPTLHSQVFPNGTYLDVLTNPLTMTASCVKEMATGIPSRPNEGLSNFHPEHPGTPDGWTLASESDRDNDGIYDYRVGIVGDYVWGDLYADNENINFMKHRYGHADYYQGDTESFETLNSWLDGEVPKSNTKPGVTFEQAPNVIIAHLSGLDSVGHRYGVENSDEYEEKLTWLDNNFNTIFDKVPDDWTVVVTSDHGLTASGQHGSPDKEIREVGAWMWGPNIKQNYISPTQIDQRDLSTLPSLLLSLPLPHAVHGKFPLDALQISDDLTLEEVQELDQWNWNSTVSRNEWMQENGHPYFEDLSRDNIQWEKITYDEIGMRISDLIMSAIFFCAIIAGIVFVMRKHEFSPNAIKYAAGSLFGIFALSSAISYNRDTLALLYYMIGYFTPLVFAGLTLVLVCTNKFSKVIRQRMTAATMCLFAVMIMYPESRVSAINIVMLLMLFTPIFWKAKESMKTDKVILGFFTLAIIPTTLLSHYRVYYFSFPRGAINFSVSGDFLPLIMNTVLTFIGIIIYMRAHKIITEQRIRYSIVGFFTLIPLLMYQENNIVDWAVLIILITAMVTGIYLKIVKQDKGYEIISMVALCWLTMSWGGYAGGITMALFVAFRSFLDNELSFLKEKSTDFTKEIPRTMIVTILPLVVWFTWWAALGQIGGFSSPRDVDPGSVYLNGGYIGDRFSPSNSWVGFMGGGPAAAMSLLWFSMFYSKGYNMKFVAYYLVARISILSLQLSLTPNLPRLIFKISWDIIFSIGLVAFMIHLIIQSRIEEQPENQVTLTQTQ